MKRAKMHGAVFGHVNVLPQARRKLALENGFIELIQMHDVSV
jgi:hypothetical protein